MSRGFTLLEVVVALLLLELAVVGAVGTLVLASRTLGEAERLERAVSEADGVLDSLAGVAGAVGGVRTRPEGRLDWTIEPNGEVVVRAANPAGATWFEVYSWLPCP